MSEWMRVIAYALLTVFLGVILKEVGFRGTRLVVLVGTVAILAVTVLSVGRIFSALPEVSEDNKEYVVAMLKIVGVGYAFGICSDVCCEMGEVTLSSAVSLFGRAEIIAISLPFIKRIIERGIELI